MLEKEKQELDLELEYTNKEMRTTRELMRELKATLALLEEDNIQKIVVMNHNKPKGILLSVQQYLELLENQKK